jgi:hypothetical protein
MPARVAGDDDRTVAPAKLVGGDVEDDTSVFKPDVKLPASLSLASGPDKTGEAKRRQTEGKELRAVVATLPRKLREHPGSFAQGSLMNGLTYPLGLHSEVIEGWGLGSRSGMNHEGSSRTKSQEH